MSPSRERVCPEATFNSTRFPAGSAKSSVIVAEELNFATSPAAGTPLGDQLAAASHLPSDPVYMRSTPAAANTSMAATMAAAKRSPFDVVTASSPSRNAILFI